MASAKQLFLNENNKNPLQHLDEIYTACLQKKYLHAVDFLCAKSLLPSVLPEVKFFLAYLFSCYRRGHLCVIVENGSIKPSLGEYDAMLIEGSRKIPQEIINQEGQTNKPLFFTHNHWYLHTCWMQETRILNEVQRIQKSSPLYLFPQEEIQKSLQLSLENSILQKEQLQAVFNAYMHSLSIIFGGPGTGKSYTAAHLIKEIFQKLNANQKKYYEIAVTAPTGKAVANLRNQIYKILPEISAYPFFKAVTLHALLETKRLKKQESLLSADLIIVDECSMIDAHLMAHLLCKVKEGSRVILIGDPEQLPPIQAGNIFKEFSLYEHTIPKTTLKQSLRIENQSLNHFAHLIKSQDVDALVNEISTCDAVNYQTFTESSFSIQTAVIKRISSQWPMIKQWQPDLALVKAFFKKYCVLSAVRKGLFGVDTLNEALHQEHANSVNQNEDLVIPIMITANNADMDLYNGDLGLLVKQSGLRRAFFIYEEGLRSFPETLLPDFEYAYVQSIHKSQGSEYDRILILLPEGAEVFGNELLYTAFTRARQKVEIYSFQNTFYELVKNQSQRLSGLSWRLSISQQS